VNAYSTCCSAPPYSIAHLCQVCLTDYAAALSSVPCVDTIAFEAVTSACTSLGCGSSCNNLPCQYPPASSCDFYQTCVEAVKPCGLNGYALAFGLQFCTNFIESEGNFTQIGYQWSQYVRPCLQKALAALDISQMTCDESSSFAIGSHLSCYNDRAPGDPTPTFCQVHWSDRLQILSIIKGVFLTSRAFAIAWQGTQILFWDCPNKGVTNVLVHLATDYNAFAALPQSQVQSWADSLEQAAAASLRSVLAPDSSDDWGAFITVAGFYPGSVAVYLALNFNDTLPWNTSHTLADAANILASNFKNGTINTTWPVLDAGTYQPSPNIAHSFSPSLFSLLVSAAAIILAQNRI